MLITITSITIELHSKHDVVALVKPHGIYIKTMLIFAFYHSLHFFLQNQFYRYAILTKCSALCGVMIDRHNNSGKCTICLILVSNFFRDKMFFLWFTFYFISVFTLRIYYFLVTFDQSFKLVTRSKFRFLFF